MHKGLPVVLRIMKIATEDGTVLQLAGRLEADGVRALEQLCREVGWPLRLDLSDLKHVDDSGLASIREFVARGAELVNVPPFTNLLLESEEPRGPAG